MTKCLREESDFRQAVVERLGSDWVDNGAIIAARYVIDSPNRDVYRGAQGSRQRRRSLDPMESGFHDLPRYRQTIARALKRLGDTVLAVDLGCGDGRGIHMLLDGGCWKIVAVDFNEGDLLSLWEGLNAEARKRVVAVCATIDRPISLGSDTDLILMLEVLSTLPDPVVALRSAANLLRPGGIVIISEPSINGHFVHALLNNDWDNISRILTSKTYADNVGNEDIKLYLRSFDELKVLAQKSGLVLIGHDVYPASKALLLHAMKRTNSVDTSFRLVEQLTKHDPTEISRLNVLTLQRPRGGDQD